MSCGVQNGGHANKVSILIGITKSQFSRIHNSMISYPNGIKFTVELAFTQGRPHFDKYQEKFVISEAIGII